jgi:hypothetical protein
MARALEHLGPGCRRVPESERKQSKRNESESPKVPRLWGLVGVSGGLSPKMLGDYPPKTVGRLSPQNVGGGYPPPHKKTNQKKEERTPKTIGSKTEQNKSKIGSITKADPHSPRPAPSPPAYFVLCDRPRTGVARRHVLVPTVWP